MNIILNARRLFLNTLNLHININPILVYSFYVYILISTE